jgi:hypothetical protein
MIKFDINKDDKIDINKDDKIDINKDDKIDINKDDKIDINKDDKIDINKDNSTYNVLKNIINNNIYIKNCISNKNKDINSISYLIDYKLSQSDCIKLGIGLEKILQDFILIQNVNLINIKQKNKKGDKEKDHLFIDNNNKIIYYAELKSNLNLDTEKSKSTCNKCLDIKKELCEKYKDYKINMFLVSLRHYAKEIIPHNICNRYINLNDKLVGINEYLNALSILIKFNNENEYKLLLNLLAKKCLNLLVKNV